MALRFALAILVMNLVMAELQAEDHIQLEDVVVSGEHGYHTFRIPAIVATNDHTLLAFCEGRKGGSGDTGNIDMLVARSTDHGQTWSQPQLIWDDRAPILAATQHQWWIARRGPSGC